MIVEKFSLQPPKKADTDHVAGISREKMVKSKNVPHREAKPNRLKHISILARMSPRESQIRVDQARKKMPRNERCTRQTEDFPISNDFKSEGELGEV
jgi:hypothetical protein